MKRSGKALGQRPVERYFCEAVRRYRLHKRLTTEAAAKLAGIPLASYSSLEQGGYRISLENLVRICAALEVELAALWPPEIQRPALPVRPASLHRMAEEARALLPGLESVEDVIAAVIEVFGMSETYFRSPQRKRDLAAARGCAAALVHERPHLTLAELGRKTGLDISALSHGRKRLAGRGDPEVMRLLEAARQRLLVPGSS